MSGSLFLVSSGSVKEVNIISITQKGMIPMFKTLKKNVVI